MQYPVSLLIISDLCVMRSCMDVLFASKAHHLFPGTSVPTGQRQEANLFPLTETIHWRQKKKKKEEGIITTAHGTKLEQYVCSYITLRVSYFHNLLISLI